MADKDFDDGIPSTPGMMGTDPELHLRNNVWYSYLHVDAKLITKRYFSWLDYKEVGDSDFSVHVTPPYLADNKEEARAEGIRRIKAWYNRGRR